MTKLAPINFLLCLCLISPAWGQDKKSVTFEDYKNNEVSIAEEVLMPLDEAGQTSQIYFVSEFDYIITESNDKDLVLKKGSIGENKETFLKVEINNLITTKPINRFDSQQAPVTYYVKVKWEGEKGDLAMTLAGKNIVQGKIIFNQETNKFQVSLDRLTDLVFMDLFMPTLELSEMFGRSPSTEADIMKEEVTLWFKTVITRPLEEYLNKSNQSLP